MTKSQFSIQKRKSVRNTHHRTLALRRVGRYNGDTPNRRNGTAEREAREWERWN
jgi:hypothetical protein